MDPTSRSFRESIRARFQPTGQSWYSIANAAGPVAEVRIYDEIGFWGITADDFASELSQITADQIVVAINSPGGEVWDGVAIYNALRIHPASVTTRVDSLAASVASIIVQAGDVRQMVDSAQMMIHKAWGLFVGNADDARTMADILDQQDGILAAIYADRGKGTAADFLSMMADSTWLTAAQAVEHGLADAILTPKRQQAKAELPSEPPEAELHPDLTRQLIDALTL